jgi:hypothetical protein
VSTLIEDDGPMSEDELQAWLDSLDSSEDVTEQG